MRRVLLAVLAMLVFMQAYAAPPDKQQYIVKLKSVTLPPNANAPTAIRDLVKKGAGNIDFDWPDRIVVTLPSSAVQGIAHHPATKYMQLVEHHTAADGATAGQPLTAMTSADRVAVSATKVMGNARTVATGNPAQRPARTLTMPSPPWDSGTYSYDPSGNITGMGTTDAFTYDVVGRLATATVKGINETYSYDSYGNMKQMTSGLAPSTVIYTIDPSNNNHVTAVNGVAISYDTAGAGNVTNDGSVKSTYDAFNMLHEKDVTGGTSEFYVYDANDERIAVISGCVSQTSPNPPDCSTGMMTASVRDEQGKILKQYEVPYPEFAGPSADGMVSPWTWVENYVYRDQLLLGSEREDNEGGRRHFHLDHLGTPRLITNANGVALSAHDYTPFGVEITALHQETGSPVNGDREEPRKFTGHERDFNIGTTSQNSNYYDYMHARYYGPSMGRFMSVDPNVDAEKAMTHLQMWNRYAYVSNNPINKFDPDGRAETDLRCTECGTPAMQAAFRSGQIEALKWGAITGGLLLGGEAGISALAVRFPLTFMRLMGVAVTATSGVAVNSVSLDTNAVIAAVENPGGSSAAVTQAIGSRTPAISATVVDEFLTKGSFSGLANYIKGNGGVITKDAAAELVTQLEARGLKPNDAKAVAGAIESGTTFLTRDKDILKKVPDIAERY